MSTIPFTVKFNSNSVLYDSIGSLENNYISLFYDKDNAYFLLNTAGTYLQFDKTTETMLTAVALTGTSLEYHSLVTFKDKVYAFEGYDAKHFRNDSVLYISKNDKLVQESFDRKLLVTHLSSTTGIRDFLVDEDYNFYVVHSKNKISKFTKEKNLLYSIPLTAGSDTVFALLSILPNSPLEILKIDFVREYTDEGIKKYPIVLGIGDNKKTFLAKIDETNKIVLSAVYTGLTGEYIKYGESNKVNYNLTNYEYLKNAYTNTSELVFKVVLNNVFDNRKKLSVEIPVSIDKFTSESHHFAYKLDGINGQVSLLCDGKLVSAVNIPAGQYIFQDLFNDTFTVGNTYFGNNIILSNYIQQPLYYHVDNVTMKKFKVYKRILTNTEVNYHVYDNLKIEDLVVSLPCGQRSEIEGIERQFKLDVSGSKSNSINLIIKNSQITNTNLQESMKEVILDKVKDVLPATINVNNIEFR